MEVQEEKINLLSYIDVFVKYRKFLVLNFFAVCLVVAGVSLFLSNWYSAKTTILPPEKETPFLSGLSSSLLQGFSSLGSGLSLPGLATPSDVLASILKSRSVGEAVIQKEDLMRYYKTNKMETALRELWSHLKVSVGNEGIILLEFEDRDRKKSASIANTFIVELDRINQQTAAARARNTRVFIEERLKQTQGDLKLAEENLKSFQEENKAIALDEQTKAAIEAAALLKAQLTMDEIELNVLKNSMAATPQIQKLQSKISETKRQLTILESGEKTKNPGTKKVLSVPFSEVPSMALEYARLLREVKIQEAVFELLTQQYEQSKIQESKDTPTIQVLDRAVPPDRKSKPKRAYLVLMSGLASLFMGTFFVFGMEYLDKYKIRDPQGYEKLKHLYDTILEDLRILKKRKV